MQQPRPLNIGGTTADTHTQWGACTPRPDDPLGAPCFDDTCYLLWKIQMKGRLIFFDPPVWRIVETGFSYVDEANPTDLERRNSHYNAQAMNALYCALTDDQLYQVWHLETAKEIWDALRVMHQDTSIVSDLKVKLLREKMRLFALRKGESANGMYWRFQALVDKMKRLGCKELTDSYVVRKILRAMAPRDPAMVSMICEMHNFEELTPQGVRNSFVIYDMMQESSRVMRGHAAKVDTSRETSHTAAAPPLANGDTEYYFGSSGETPRFDGTQYLSWQHRMKFHLLSMNPLVWRIVETGHVDKANPTPLEENNIQYNAQAMCALFFALSGSPFSWLCTYESAKEIWDNLRAMDEAVREPNLNFFRREMDLFALGKYETPNDMYTRLNNLVNEMKGLGCKEMTDSYVVRKMLRVMTPRNSTLVTLIRDKPNFEQLTPRDVLATFHLYDMVLKESKIVSDYASPSSSKNVKISLKAKRVLMEESSNEEHDQDQDREHIQEMTLLVKNFGRMLGKKEYEARRRSNFPDKSKIRKSKRCCYQCGASDHLVANCPINGHDD